MNSQSENNMTTAQLQRFDYLMDKIITTELSTLELAEYCVIETMEQ